MKKRNKFNPREAFFASYIALLGIFLITIIVHLVLGIEQPNNESQPSQKNTTTFQADQKTIDYLKQKQPTSKTTQAPLELTEQKRTNPFE